MTDMEQRTPHASGDELRLELLADVPMTARREDLAGVSTALLEGGYGSPMVLLHGPGASAAHWMRVFGDLVRHHRVIAPDLPGQGASVPADGPLDAGGVLTWLRELIDRTCPTPPALVGYALGGAIAARFACQEGDRLGRLVLVDALGLVELDPAPEFGRALHAFLEQPTGPTHDGLWEQCALDLRRVRTQMDERWDAFKAYNLDRARTARVQAGLGALMAQFGVPAIAPADLARITVPTELIWGRHDLATPLSVAQAASARYGWPLHVIEDMGGDPPIEQPEAFVGALLATVTA